MRAFFEDRLNVAWVISGVALLIVLIFVPNEGVGTYVLIVVAAIALFLSGKLRLRDARRDRERKQARKRQTRG